MSAIEQIIPDGYKQTEVGIIPLEWKLTDINSLVKDAILDKPLDGNHGDIHPKGSDFVSDGIPFVMASNIQNGHIKFDRCSHITKKQADSLQKGFAIEKDVLLTHKATIGNTAIIGEIQTDYLMLTPQVTYYRVLNNEQLFNQYLRHFMDGELFQAELKSASGGGTRAYIGITAQRELPIVLPSIDEQTAIANALSDVDALLMELENLIAKKQAIKTATMQQLLTGKTRLPQFATYTEGTIEEGKNQGKPKGTKPSELGEIPEDWGVVTLDDAANFLDGQRRPIKSGDRARIKGQYPYYGASGIVDYVNDFIFDGEFILLGEDGENILSRSLPLAFKASGKIWVNNHAHVMTPKQNFHIDFLIPYLESLDYSLLNSGTAQPKLNKQSCLNIKVIKPSIEEQTAIATILSDMDNEIQTLDQRLTKTRQIKQGMMQQLLTGRTRLPFKQAEEA